MIERDRILEDAAKMVEWIGDNEGVEEIAEMMAAAIRQLKDKCVKS